MHSTFNSPTLPRSIKAGFLNIPVEHFIPNPLRCFKCQRFGHHKDKCRREAVCARCGQAEHGESASCTNPCHCINCNGSHSAFDRTCPKWIVEKEVQHVKTINGLSFPEARKLVESRVPTVPSGPSYANAAKVVEPKKQSVSVTTQTDITWPHDAKNYKLVKSTQPSTSTPSTSVASLSTQTSAKSPEAPKDDSPRKTSKKERQKVLSDRSQKGSQDPIQQHNRFGALTDMDTTDVSKAQRHRPEPGPRPSLARLPTNTS